MLNEQRMIVCPQCFGATYAYGPWVCGSCDGSGTIPDRRRPTANDLAVERIKALCESRRAKTEGVVNLAAAMVSEAVLHIIREEESRA